MPRYWLKAISHVKHTEKQNKYINVKKIYKKITCTHLSTATNSFSVSVNDDTRPDNLPVIPSA